MTLSTKNQRENLDVIEKINSVFLGARDFRKLAEQSTKLMTNELRGAGVLGVSIFRVHEEEHRLYSYAYAARSFEIIEKLLPRKFSELNLTLNDKNSLLVRAVVTKEIQENSHLYEFTRPTFSEALSANIQKVLGCKFIIAYPLRLRHGKVIGVLAVALENSMPTDELKLLLETFRLQFELAFENVLEFERVVKRYKKSLAPADESKPTVHFMLRITPKQNALLEQRAKEAKLDKTSYIRSWIDSGAGR